MLRFAKLYPKITLLLALFDRLSVLSIKERKLKYEGLKIIYEIEFTSLKYLFFKVNFLLNIC